MRSAFVTITIFVDADATPRDALQTVRSLGEQFHAEVTTVSSIHHQIDGDRHITVDAHPQATDMRIVGLIEKGVPTIVITQDYGLASLVLAKGAYALSPAGLEYTNQNIDQLLFERTLNAHERKVTGRSRGVKPRSASDRSRFYESLKDILTRLASS